jgi:hypothetical protein
MHIGDEFRKFTDKTCPAFDTRELDREVDARDRRQQKKEQSHLTKSTRAADGPRRKKFNLQTFKYHSLGDYAKTIRRFGTTDSYSTEPVSTGAFVASLGADIHSPG